MAWSLEIHHLDVRGPGDATLIVARDDGVGHGLGPYVRTALIDGGLLGASGIIDLYLNTQVAGLGVPGPGAAAFDRPLDVMVVTHYDADHVGGIRGLLKLNPPAPATTIYDHTLIYDQGELPASGDSAYDLYAPAIGIRPGRTRVTRNVVSGSGPINRVVAGVRMMPAVIPGVLTPVRTMGAHGPSTAANVTITPPPGPPANTTDWWHPYWLVGREILWTDRAGEPIASPRPGVPPTITCIAANRYVRTGPTTATFRSTGQTKPLHQQKNEKSLAFEVRFGTFRYYIGGDIEEEQEQTISTYLNGADSVAGRVHLVKASHHGANTASSHAFVHRMRPEAVMISCGTRNRHDHPADRTVGILEGYDGVTAPVPPPASRPVPSYLTGYQVLPVPAPPTPPVSRGGPSARTAGSPPPVAGVPERGHIRVNVSPAQSTYDSRGMWAYALVATITATASAVGVAVPPAVADNATGPMHGTGPHLARVEAVIDSVLGDLGHAAASPATRAAVAGLAGGLVAVVPTVYAAATGAGVPPAAAAVTAAAAGLAHDIFAAADPAAAAPLAGQATQIAATQFGVAAIPAAAAAVGVQVAVQAAIPAAGRFSVTYYDLQRPGGPGSHSVTHF